MEGDGCTGDVFLETKMKVERRSSPSLGSVTSVSPSPSPVSQGADLGVCATEKEAEEVLNPFNGCDQIGDHPSPREATTVVTNRPGRSGKQPGWCGPRTPETACHNEEPPGDVDAEDELLLTDHQNLLLTESHHGDAAASKKTDKSKKDRSINLHDDHGELDYDEDEDGISNHDQSMEAAGDVDEQSNQWDENMPTRAEELQQQPSEKQEGPQSTTRRMSDKNKDDEPRDGDKSDEGEIQDEDCEEGEIKDDEKRPFVRTQLCRFFKRGHCTWGYSCRFLHPGINDKGNYSLVDRPGLAPVFSKPVTAEAMEQVNVPPVVPPFIAAAPKTETAWERGLRQAKEAMRRASRKKETETDLEYKKLSISLADAAENKENDKKYKDPYYDDVDDVDITLVLDQTKRAVDVSNEPPRKSQWRGGQYENFEVRPQREPHDGRNDYRGKDTLPSPVPYNSSKPPVQYETRSSNIVKGTSPPLQLSRKERASPVSFPQDSLKSAEARSRDNGSQQSFPNRADDWHDPWQRSRESRAKRRSATPDRRRRESRGSASSGSSGSSYSRSRSASYSSSYSDGNSSRSSSGSSASSRSSSKSRSRASLSKRGPGLMDRGAQPMQQPRKPLLQQPLLPLPQQQTLAAAGKAQRGYRDDRPIAEQRRGREDWQGATRGMPPPSSASSVAGARDNQNIQKRAGASPSVQPRYQPFLVSSTPVAKVPGRPAGDSLQKIDRAEQLPPFVPSRPGVPYIGKGPIRRNRSESSGSMSSRSESSRSPPAKSRHVPEGSKLQKGSMAARPFGSRRATSPGGNPPRDDRSSSRSASPQKTDKAERDRRYRSRSPIGDDDVYGDLDRVPLYAQPPSGPMPAGTRDNKQGMPARGNVKEVPRRAEDIPVMQLTRDVAAANVRLKTGPPAMPVTSAVPQPKARLVTEVPKTLDVPGVSRPPPKVTAAPAMPASQPGPEQLPPARTAASTGIVQKSAIKLTLISKPQPLNIGARKRNAINEGSVSPPPAAAPPSKRPPLPFGAHEVIIVDKQGMATDKAKATAKPQPAAEATFPGVRTAKAAGGPATVAPVPIQRAVGSSTVQQPSATAGLAVTAAMSAGGLSKAAAAKKTTSSRREELLKQLKAVEDAIARKRSKV